MMELKLILLIGLASSIVHGVPLVSVEETDKSDHGRQGILEIPKGIATIIRNVISDAVLGTSTNAPPPLLPPRKRVTYQPTQTPSPPKESLVQSISVNKVVSPATPDTILEEFLLHNFLGSTKTPWAPIESDTESPTPTTHASVTVTEKIVEKVSSTPSAPAKAPIRPKPNPSESVPAISSGNGIYPSYPAYPPLDKYYINSADVSTDKPFEIIENAFPTDFDDGVYILGIVSSSTKKTPFGKYTLRPTGGPAPLRRSTPPRPEVVTVDETENPLPQSTFSGDEEEDETTTEERTTKNPDDDDDNEGGDEAGGDN